MICFGYIEHLILFSESCLKEDTGKPNLRGIFAWKSTDTSSYVSVKCPYGSSLMATRKCMGNFDSGGTWGEPSIMKCPFKSKNTEVLDKLIKVKL